ncbi:MAG: hypothetical protein MPN21_12355, partial [Thermoanaerobaculia bacterium]|nr:hypothetical protein [Thermoanaerobaculia bacterium]
MNTRYLVSILVLLNVAAAPAVHSHTDSEHVAWVLEPRQISVKSSTAEAVELRDEVAIIELVGDYDRALADGAQNLEPRTAIGHEFYSLLEDDYDFLVAFSTFAFDAGPARAFAWGIQNSDSGIGLPIFDSSELFGSGGRLQSFIDMGELASHVTDPLDPAFEDTLVILAHEIMHRWGVHVHFRLPDGTSSDALLGLEGSHWSFLADTGASVMYGNDWRDEGDGSFTSTGVLKFFSPLDLYLAGLYSPDEVPPFFVIDDSGEDPTRLPHLGAQISGTRRAVTVEDIIAAEGPRVPAVGEAPNEFRLAFLLITRPGDVVTPAMLDGINRVRREFQIRFSALTGGRALVDVYPPVVADGDPGSPSGVDGGDLRPDAVLEDGLAWLRGRQSPEGYWEDRPATRVRDTTLAVATLASLDPLFSGFDEAITWLEAQPGPSTDTLARLAISLDGVTASVASLRSTLVERRNPDGGWGVAPGYASDPLDSALAIQALAGYDDSVVESGVTYLLAAQNADGGWPVHAGGASRTSVTTAVVRAFESAGRQAELPSSTFAWLAGQQNPDGGFGDSPSTVHDTANTLEALSSVSGLSFVDGSAASSFLTARQTVDGSWDGSVYGTSLALSAIKRFTFPNLALVGQPTVDPSAPRDGERVRLTYEVLNDGRLTAANSVLRLYEGDPALGGTAVGEVALPAIASGQSVHATLLWDSLDRAGTQLLVAVLDPEDVLTELSELDNRIQTEIQVQAAPEEPDLEIAAEEISFSPASPSELPQLLGITAVVRNLGQTDASDVLVRLYLGEAEDAVLAGETTISVPQRSSSPANFSYLLENPGTTWFTVVVDPEDVSSEADESNNSASVAVSTTGTVDLEVTPSDVTLLGSPFSGNDLTFRVALRNRGTLDSPDSVVRYTVTDGTTVRDLGTATVQIPAGGSVERDVVWRVDLLGDLEFRAEIDGDDLVPEADEDNNLAVVPFVATEVTGADLVLTRGDLSFDPNPGLEGASLTFTAALRNTGGEAVANAEVGFYDGDPGHGGTLLGTAVVPSIGPGETVDAVFVESRVESAADRLIFAVADPNGLVAEFGEDNNATFELLEVSSLPDPAVGVASLELTPRFPQPGQNVTLTVRVANLGEQGVTGLVVRALDNGVAVGGDQVIEVPGAGEATAVFAWDVGVADSESRSVSVVLDPDDIVEEGSEANNQASIPLSVQDGDFFVTHRFFSPNGDGVQDETDLFFRLEAPTPVAIEVVDSQRQNVVRRSDFGNVSAGQFTWDGRDDFGRLVRDADYELRLVATATDAVLDQALVSLDTDRVSLLRAGGTGFETFTNLTCELPTVADVSETIDEQWTFFSVIGSVDSAYPSGVWRMRTDGTGLQQVVGPGFLGNRSVFNLTVSPDGSRIAFVTSRELWVGRGDGSALVELVNPGSATRSDLPVGFDSNGTTLIAERISGGSGLVLWQVDGSGDSAILTTDRTDDHRMSADGRYLLYFDR